MAERFRGKMMEVLDSEHAEIILDVLELMAQRHSSLDRIAELIREAEEAAE